MVNSYLSDWLNWIEIRSRIGIVFSRLGERISMWHVIPTKPIKIFTLNKIGLRIKSEISLAPCHAINYPKQFQRGERDKHTSKLQICDHPRSISFNEAVKAKKRMDVIEIVISLLSPFKPYI